MIVFAVAAAVVMGRGLPAQPPKPGQSIDDELIKDLDSKMSDDLDRQLFGPNDKRPSKPGQAQEPSKPRQGRAGGEPAPGKLSRELGAAAVSENENPLVEIAQQMRLAGTFLGRAQSGTTTQQLQAEIVAELDKLIQQARCGGGQCMPSQAKSPSVAPRQQVKQPKSPSKPSSKPGQHASKPSKNSQAATGKPASGRPDPGRVMAVLKQHWGELPEHAREQMLQGMGAEEFLPKYEVLIEEYYKRLAEGDVER